MEPEQTAAEPDTEVTQPSSEASEPVATESATTKPAETTEPAAPEAAATEPAATKPAAATEPGATAAEEKVKSKPVPKRTKVRSTNPADGPDIAMGEAGISAEEPITIGQMFKMTVSQIPDQPALKYKTGETTWGEYTFQEYFDLTISAAKSFLKVHVE